MIDIVLTIVIALLLVERYLSQKTNTQEREKLLKMFMAKDLQEITANEVIEKQPPPPVVKPPDVVSMDDVVEDEELFDKHIQAVKAQAQEEFDKANEV